MKVVDELHANSIPPDKQLIITEHWASAVYTLTTVERPQQWLSYVLYLSLNDCINVNGMYIGIWVKYASASFPLFLVS